MTEEKYVEKRWGGQSLVINDIICNGLVERDREKEAQQQWTHILVATHMRATIKMHVNRFAPTASSGKNAQSAKVGATKQKKIEKRRVIFQAAVRVNCLQSP